jgi:hypothetical protein
MGYYNRSYFTPAGGYNPRSARSTYAKREATVTYTAEHVWAMAVAIDRINGGYFKEDVYVYENECRKRATQANKMMLKEWVQTGVTEVTEEDRLLGREYRTHFQGLLFREISGGLNDFLQSAMRIAGKDEFTDVDNLDLAILASLPATAKRDIARQTVQNERRELSRDSQHVGRIGDKVSADVEVLSCFYSQKWNTFYVNAKADTNVLMFAYRTELARGTTAKIQGTVKAHRDDGVTQLNRVKVTV